MSDKLSHLSESQISELIRKYYNNEKIADLIKEYDLDIKPAQLVKEFPIIAHEIKCKYCTIKIVSYYKSKTSSIQIGPPECSKCGHEETSNCYCLNCRKLSTIIKQRELEAKQEYLTKHLNSNTYTVVHFNNLTFTQKVYLGAFLRSGISEDFSFINPIETFIDPLAPTDSLQNEMISSLCSDLFDTGKPLTISPSSDAACFPDLKVNGNDFGYYQDKVNWDINVVKQGISSIALINQLRNPTEEIYNTEELYEIWRKISLHECLEYFLLNISNLLKVEYSIGVKTIATFNDLLDNFPTSQIYYIIYKAVGDALRFKVERATSAKHASNTVIGYAQSYAERAIAGDWNVPKFGRRDCPQSAISKFFFERILKIGSDGFYKKPELVD